MGGDGSCLKFYFRLSGPPRHGISSDVFVGEPTTLCEKSWRMHARSLFLEAVCL
jgi:hypothetical protein